MKKGITMGILGLAIASFATCGATALAYQGQPGAHYTPERHEIMTKAFETKNYSAWKEQMGNKGPARVVTEQNFERFAQLHQLQVEGKTDEANQIRQELGLGMGQRNGNGEGNHARRTSDDFIDQNGDGICDNLQ